MFNLDQSILEWRRQMLAASIKSPAPLDELESHLRDEIEHHVNQGLNEAQAFKAAVQNLGPAPTLQQEFRKIEKFKEEREEKRNKILLAISSVTVLLAMAWMVFFAPKDIILSSSDKVFALFPGVIFFLLPWVGQLNYRSFPIGSKRYSIIFCSFGVLLLWFAAFSYIILPRYEFTMGRVAVTFLWATLVPTAFFVALVLGIERRAKSTRV